MPTIKRCRFCDNNIMKVGQLCPARALLWHEGILFMCEPAESAAATPMARRIAAGIERRQKFGAPKKRK